MDFVHTYRAQLMARRDLMLCDLAAHDGVPAAVVDNADVRVVPSYAYRGSEQFDENQISVLLVGEPVRILERQIGWYRVRAYNVAGWVRRDKLALGAWPDPFLGEGVTVVEDSIFLNGRRLTMGARLPLSPAGEVLLPRRLPNGELTVERCRLPGGMVRGFLPPEPQQAVAQARRLLGNRYGWGGLYGQRDCSSLLCDVMKTLGVCLPRDAAYQARIPGRVLARDQIVPGAMLWMPGHAMLCSGGRGESARVIHALGTCLDEQGARWEANRVVETSLMLRRASTGQRFLDALTSIRLIF